MILLLLLVNYSWTMPAADRVHSIFKCQRRVDLSQGHALFSGVTQLVGADHELWKHNLENVEEIDLELVPADNKTEFWTAKKVRFVMRANSMSEIRKLRPRLRKFFNEIQLVAAKEFCSKHHEPSFHFPFIIINNRKIYPILSCKIETYSCIHGGAVILISLAFFFIGSTLTLMLAIVSERQEERQRGILQRYEEELEVDMDNTTSTSLEI